MPTFSNRAQPSEEGSTHLNLKNRSCGPDPYAEHRLKKRGGRQEPKGTREPRKRKIGARCMREAPFPLFFLKKKNKWRGTPPKIREKFRLLLTSLEAPPKVTKGV